MALNTVNFNLTKPELGDSITPTIFANNFDIIDAEMAKTNGLTFVVITESAYTALATKDSNTIYFITE